MDPIAHTLVGASSGANRPRKARALRNCGAHPRCQPYPISTAWSISSEVTRGFTTGEDGRTVRSPSSCCRFFSEGCCHYWDTEANLQRGLGLWYGLSYLGVATHPLLDWLNTYGIRLLMPLDPRWFYGDAVFIVDPWIWLVSGSRYFSRLFQESICSIRLDSRNQPHNTSRLSGYSGRPLGSKSPLDRRMGVGYLMRFG